MYYTSTGF